MISVVSIPIYSVAGTLTAMPKPLVPSHLGAFADDSSFKNADVLAIFFGLRAISGQMFISYNTVQDRSFL